MREIKLNGNDFTTIADGVLEQKGLLRFEAHGRSMYPFIKDGDVLTVEQAEADSLKPGDVALYRFGDRLRVHRVMRGVMQSDPPVLIIRGDAAPGIDEHVEAEQILGRVMSLERDGKVIQLGSGRMALALLRLRDTWLNRLIPQPARKLLRSAIWLLQASLYRPLLFHINQGSRKGFKK